MNSNTTASALLAVTFAWLGLSALDHNNAPAAFFCWLASMCWLTIAVVTILDNDK